MAQDQELLFYYFGDDEAYFRTLVGEFRKHTKLAFKFERYFSPTESEIQALFLRVATHKPKCVFIDFSKQTTDYLHLARLIARTNFEHRPLTVGLVDYLSPKEILAESISTGINLTHIKSAEIFDVVYDVAFLISPDGIPHHGFASANPAETWECGAVTKIGYAHKTGLHLETSFRLSKGDRVKLYHYWSREKIVPSREVFVTGTTNRNLFYHFNIAADVEFLFIDEFIPPEGMDEATIKLRQEERDDQIKRSKKKMSDWVNDNLGRSQEKHTKFLIIDKEFRFFNAQTRSDKYAYIIRCAPYMPEVADELNRLCPQFIAISMDPKELADGKITFDYLEKLVSVVKRDHKDISPYIVVFNTPITTKDLRFQLHYDNLMATDLELEPDLLIKMAELLNKKLAESKKAEPPKKDDIQKVYLRKSHSASHGLFMMNVNILKISETDITFTCDRELFPGTNLYFSHPVPFYVNVLPTKSKSKNPEYSGLIHCIGESDKKELRVFVNSIFFRDHDAKNMAEMDEFKRLNDNKLNEKLEAIRIAQEKELAEAEKNSNAPPPNLKESTVIVTKDPVPPKPKA